jgi:K+-transporting ATPase A subunit
MKIVFSKDGGGAFDINISFMTNSNADIYHGNEKLYGPKYNKNVSKMKPMWRKFVVVI